ncbi:hypothetical protein E2C01_061694 [Portunus trituberculatus]|uniref:Uncharacterized protein n=1 Tax=Portunus trituberculatus TaxID=210409 RepID=A0A5B7HDY6_PORTR|nr:hypothetical protein [Portunus trituberculatus]
MTRHTPHLSHCHEVSPLTTRGLLILSVSGAWCTAWPRSWLVVQHGAITVKGPVDIFHQTVWKEPLSPHQDFPYLVKDRHDPCSWRPLAQCEAMRVDDYSEA